MHNMLGYMTGHVTKLAVNTQCVATTSRCLLRLTCFHLIEKVTFLLFTSNISDLLLLSWKTPFFVLSSDPCWPISNLLYHEDNFRQNCLQKCFTSNFLSQHPYDPSCMNNQRLIRLSSWRVSPLYFGIC